MAIIRTFRVLPALVVALVALCVVASSSALASSHASSHRSTVAAKHHHKHKRHKRHKKHRKHATQTSTPAPTTTPMPSGTGTGTGTGTPSGTGSQSTPSTPKSFEARDAAQTSIGAGPDGTVIESLSLPANAKYVVTAKAELGNSSANPNSVSCQLLENFNPLDSGTQALAPQATFSGTITLTATSTGGALKLSCTGDRAAFARNRVITAVQTS
jgi:Ni/Co efflux regulator RcnB